MPFLEQPTVLKFGIVLVALLFLYNIFMTMMKTKKWTVIQGVLLGGLVMLAGMFLFGVFFMKNLSTQYFWWGSRHSGLCAPLWHLWLFPSQ
jgi:nitric oxide reductase subunit B